MATSLFEMYNVLTRPVYNPLVTRGWSTTDVGTASGGF